MNKFINQAPKTSSKKEKKMKATMGTIRTIIRKKGFIHLYSFDPIDRYGCTCVDHNRLNLNDILRTDGKPKIPNE